MHVSKSRFLTRGEVWFDEDPGQTGGVDWIIYHQRSRPLPGTKWRAFDTYVVDLTDSPEQMLARLSSNTAYKIRRARERDRIICERCDCSDPAVLADFEEMYKSFAAMKGLESLDRAQLNSLAAAGALDLSVAKDPQGRALVYHADYRNHTRARALTSPSLYRALSDSSARNLIGRANRYLTWSDLLRYKDAGLKYYDFGGWYHGTDPAMLKINDFKREFGGRIERTYECERIVTLKGWLVLKVARLVRDYNRKKLPADSRPERQAEVDTAVAVPS